MARLLLPGAPRLAGDLRLCPRVCLDIPLRHVCPACPCWENVTEPRDRKLDMVVQLASGAPTVSCAYKLCAPVMLNGHPKGAVKLPGPLCLAAVPINCPAGESTNTLTVPGRKPSRLTVNGTSSRKESGGGRMNSDDLDG